MSKWILPGHYYYYYYFFFRYYITSIFYNFFYNYADGMKKYRWYNMQIRNITRTDIPEKYSIKKKKQKSYELFENNQPIMLLLFAQTVFFYQYSTS